MAVDPIYEEFFSTLLALTMGFVTISERLLPEFDQEMKTTRRLLERVPRAAMEWRPHAKSFPLGHLTQLICRMPGWITNVLKVGSLDLATTPGYSIESPAALLGEFDTNVREARAALAEAKDADFDVEWTLKYGGRVLHAAPCGEAVRQNISHLVHHRGQLSVYLRLLDVPLPPIYGPTADERTF